MPLPSLAVPDTTNIDNSSRGGGASTQLRTLSQVTVAPQWTSQRGQVLARLTKIEYVAVRSYVDRAGIRSYVVEVYERTSKNRIPTNTRSSTKIASPRSPRGVGEAEVVLDSSRKPSARLERRYAQFADMRGEVYNHAHQAHGFVPCEFCKNVIDEIVWGEKPNYIIQYTKSEEKIMQLLAKSVNTLLAIVKNNGDRRLCTGQIDVPQALLDFLTDNDNGDASSESSNTSNSNHSSRR